MNESCIIHHTKRKKSIINPHLLDKQNAWDNLELIKSLHREKYKIFIRMKRSSNSKTLRKLAEEVEQIEFNLQDAWGFPKNKNFHRWFEVPKCMCPKMENMDNLGTEYRIYMEDCPVHGHFIK